MSMITHSDPFDHMIQAHQLEPSTALQLIREAKTFEELRDSTKATIRRPECPGTFIRTSHLEFINEIRALMRKAALEERDEDIVEEGELRHATFRKRHRKSSQESQQDAASDGDKR